MLEPPHEPQPPDEREASYMALTWDIEIAESRPAARGDLERRVLAADLFDRDRADLLGRVEVYRDRGCR